ncbi:MFS transporter, partial [Candidatus Bathyarchaeota archaeon]|nr:MFS transporter [Candidatus Bathyarchaeota archaeon]
MDNAWAWRIPTIVQAGMPAVVCCLIMFFPESPRWLISQDRAEEALAIFAKYHGDGDVDAELVRLQYREVVEDYAGSDRKPWWDFRDLVDTGPARYRLYMVIG